MQTWKQNPIFITSWRRQASSSFKDFARIYIIQTKTTTKFSL